MSAPLAVEPPTAPAARRRILVARRLHSFAGSAPSGRAIAIAGQTVHAVGEPADLSRSFPDAEIVDLGDGVVTPGLTDAHIHLVEWARGRIAPDLSAADTPEDAARWAAAAPGAWALARGWNPHRWGVLPDAAILDRFVPDRPAALQSHDMHALWVNRRALAHAGVGRDTPDPDGGRILRDHAHEPTGVLLDRATQLVLAHVPRPTPAELADAVVDAQSVLHAFGITGVHAAVMEPPEEMVALRVVDRLRASDRLRLRVLQHVPLSLLDSAIALGLRSGFGDESVRIGGVKMFLDGALGSRTAWLREPYHDEPGNLGLRVLDPDAFAGAVSRAAAHGLAAVVHAIGDAAVGLALDVLARAPATALPHRIEHVQLLPAASASRFAGVVCSMQPAHLITDWRAADSAWGVERSRRAYAFRTLRDAGATLAFGSDAPVEPADPRLGLLAATARTDAEGRPAAGWNAHERITMADALRAYTRGPAHAAGRDGREGVLAPGAVADLVVWDGDPLEARGDDILALRPRATLVAGAVAWVA